MIFLALHGKARPSSFILFWLVLLNADFCKTAVRFFAGRAWELPTVAKFLRPAAGTEGAVAGCLRARENQGFLLG